MGEFSASVRMKHERAHEHLDALRAALDAWEEPQRDRFVTEQYDEGDRDFLCYRHVVRFVSPLPADAMSKALGDFVHDYRCVLDHLIWELSLAASNGDVKNPRGVRFPSSGTRDGLHAVGETVVAEVERLHEDFAGNDADPPPLWLLCELSNADKHRAIHAVYYRARTTVPEPLDEGIPGTLYEVFDPPITEDNALILSVIRVPVANAHLLPMYVRRNVTVGVGIAETDLTPDVPFARTLDRIEQAVEEAARRLRNLLP